MVLNIPEKDVWVARNCLRARHQVLHQDARPGDEFLRLHAGFIEYMRYGSSNDALTSRKRDPEVEEILTLWEAGRRFRLSDYQELLRQECARRQSLTPWLDLSLRAEWTVTRQLA
jgi:hypothetical protein